MEVSSAQLSILDGDIEIFRSHSKEDEPREISQFLGLKLINKQKIKKYGNL